MATAEEPPQPYVEELEYAMAPHLLGSKDGFRSRLADAGVTVLADNTRPPSGMSTPASSACATGSISSSADLPVYGSEELYLTNVLLTQELTDAFSVFAGKMDTLDGDMNAFAHGRGKTRWGRGLSSIPTTGRW